MEGKAVENFVFLQVRVLFYAVQIFFKVRGITWLSAGYVIFQVEEFVRVCSRFKFTTSLLPPFCFDHRFYYFS